MLKSQQKMRGTVVNPEAAVVNCSFAKVLNFGKAF